MCELERERFELRPFAPDDPAIAVDVTSQRWRSAPDSTMIMAVRSKPSSTGARITRPLLSVTTML